MTLIALALGTAIALPTPAGAQVEPFRSWSKLSFSNGYAPGFYDLDAKRLRSFREHLYAAYDAQSSTRDLMFDFYFGLRVGGENRWLSDQDILEAGYDGASGIVRVVQQFGSVRATQYFFAPFEASGPALLAVAEVENIGDTLLADAAVFSINNLHVGDGVGQLSGERIRWVDDAFEERGPEGHLIVHRPIPSPSVHGASPENPWQRVTAGQRLIDVFDSDTTTDAVAGFEWDLSGLMPGGKRTVAVALAYDRNGNRAAIDSFLAAAITTDAAETLEKARADWTRFHAEEPLPLGISADEMAVAERALAVLRMAQVRESGPANGQIVASLPPGMWNIAWVRDQAYATDGLIAAGRVEAARRALRFLLEGQAGNYVCCDAGGGPYVGRDYALSVTRYYGNGTEESDWNQNGPNVEFDGFGLTLRNLAAYLKTTGDVDFINEHAAAIFEGTADVLLSLIETDTGLLRADSSIWETHWDNGGRQHHTYSQVAAVAGLRAAAELATATARESAPYRDAADKLAAALSATLIDGESGVLRSSLEESTAFLDGAVVEAFNWDVVSPTGPTALATLAAFRAELFTEAGRGYHRNDNGDAYDEREWVILDMRIAAAARRAGQTAHADELINWITAQARANFDIIPENFDRASGAFEGEVPMAGFGAGVYLTALWGRESGRPDDGDVDTTPGPNDEEDSANETAGCGCGPKPLGGGESPVGTALLFALVTVLLGARKHPRSR